LNVSLVINSDAPSSEQIDHIRQKLVHLPFGYQKQTEDLRHQTSIHCWFQRSIPAGSCRNLGGRTDSYDWQYYYAV